MLFLLFTAQIARTVRKFDTRCMRNEFNVHNFLQHPTWLIGQALSLRYKPVNLECCRSIYRLMLASPLILWCLVRRQTGPCLARPSCTSCALVRLEFRLVSTRDNLVLQSVACNCCYIRGMCGVGGAAGFSS